MSIMQIGGAVAIVVVAVAVAGNSGRREAPAHPAYEIPAYSKALNAQIAAYEAAVGPQAPKTSAEAGGVRLRSVGFELPTSDRTFPPGPGAELIANNCQSCHSPGMILNQPQLTRAEWTGEVAKMMHTYKAPVSDEDAAQIVTYLASLKVAP